MQIGELAARTEVPDRLLRYYEQRGLLSPRRTSGGHRVFEDADVIRVGIIRALLAAGLNTATIAIVLPCTEYRAGQLHATCPEMAGHLARERSRMSEAINRLERSRQALDSLLSISEDRSVSGTLDL
ncbi:MerR family transcriptional regulator [Nocardia sp. NPDC101769]|uniref:MerR family transcriptional regulator n=1 Tax=Nocardia sp. NPDC101769 TaxID=3364333 RepID=UPI003826BBC0